MNENIELSLHLSSNTIIMMFNQVQSVISFAQGHRMRI